MSSKTIETWFTRLLLLAAAGLFFWYAQPQVYYSLSFLYQLARYLFPEILPPISAAI